MLTFDFYLDPALTTPVEAALQFVQDDAGPAAVDKVVWFGSRDATRQCLPDGGTDVLVQATGAGAGDVALATSAIDLESAVPGAALSLGAICYGGLENVIPIYLRVLDTSHTVGVRAVTITTNDLAEYLIE